MKTKCLFHTRFEGIFIFTSKLKGAFYFYPSLYIKRNGDIDKYYDFGIAFLRFAFGIRIFWIGIK